MTVVVDRSSSAACMQETGSNTSARLLREYVYRALVNKTEGADFSTYNRLVQELGNLRQQTENEKVQSTFANLLGALAGCVSVIKEHKHQDLLNNIFGVRLWSCPKVVQDAVLDLVVHLMVANSSFMHASLEMMVLSFTEPPGPPAPDNAPGEPWQPPSNAEEVHASIISALDKVMRLVPMAPSRLLPIVVRNLPSKMRARSTQCLYMSAMFKLALTPSALAIRDGLLVASVEHLLDLDVEIRWEDIVEVPTDLDEDDEPPQEDEVEEDLFAMNDLDLNAEPGSEAARRGGWEGTVPALVAPASTSGRPPMDETADKLDSLMDLTFQHIVHRCEAGESAAVWDALMKLFETNVLNTQRSKFTQFLLFFMCMREPQTLCRKFADMLLSRLGNPHVPPITRSACAAYLASFLARASFAPESVVVHTMLQLAALAHTLAAAATAALSARTAKPPALGGPSAGASEFLTPDASSAQHAQQRHQLFYAACQAVLYLLCYHMQPLLGGGGVLGRSPPPPERARHADAVRRLVQTELPPLLGHPLAPLRVCLPSVAAEFANQAAALELLPAAVLRPWLPGGAGGGRAGRPLEMFFPFDPYLLHRSSRWLQLRSSYVRWRHGHPRGAAHEEGEEDLEGVSVEGDSVDGTSIDVDEQSAESTSTSHDSELDSDSDGSDTDVRSAHGGAASSAMVQGSSPPGSSPPALGLPRRASTGRIRPKPVGFTAGTTPSDHEPTSYPPLGADMMYGMSYGSSPRVGGHRGSDFGSTPPTLGSSPVAMSITPVGAHFMHSVPQRLSRARTMH